MAKFKKILMLGFSKNDLTEKEWGRINKLCTQKILLSNDSQNLKKELTNADCLAVKLGATVEKSMIDDAPNLKYIGMFGTGYGRIETTYAAKKRITVCNIAGYSREGVAEFVFGMILEHIREIGRAKAAGENGNYSEAAFQGYEIKDKKFGVVGIGRNGSRVAEIAHHGFLADVSYWSKNRKKAVERKGIQYLGLNPLLKQSDFLSINIAYVSETKNFFNKQRINSIKPGCVVVTTVQNEVFDLNALEQRLKKNDFTFILDHSDELTPQQAKRLLKYKNCILYPPIGYITKEATQAKLGMFVDNLENFLKGKPTNKVN